jgi:tagaturonate epimerase
MEDADGERPTLTLRGVTVLAASLTRLDGAQYALVTTRAGERRLAVIAPPGSASFGDFQGTASEYQGQSLLLCPLSERNAAALRRRVAWLRPTTLGLRTSAGLGDRLGLATPGHLQAMRAVGGSLAAIPAQQSIREMDRTERTPQNVMDDAMWGILEAGWQAGFGADADHLKTTADIDRCLAAGYTFYTFDPGEYVDATAGRATSAQLRTLLSELPWPRLEDDPAALVSRYLSRPIRCEGHPIHFDEATLLRAAAKYGRAIAHVVALSRHLATAAAGRPWEVEVSVDETDLPTTPAEHVYIATELRRLGVRWVSLAPRYIGQFEKGIDYLGDVAAFEADFAVHAAIARSLGAYKLSLHSGSDKFGVYEACARQTQGLVHLKTAGTSYLEALRTIAGPEPALLRAIYRFARERFEADKATYHISARLDRAPEPAMLTDRDLPLLLDQDDARQILHVTFGSVLTARDDNDTRRYYGPLMQALRRHRDLYAANLRAHFVRHLAPFVACARG